MTRKLLLVALGALATAAVVSRRRRAKALPVPAVPERNGRQAEANESLRRFVEAGERLRGQVPGSSAE